MMEDKKTIRVTVWNEFRHEKKDQAVKEIYPEGIHTAIAEGLNRQEGIQAGTAVMDEAEHGLSEEKLERTDVLLWWSHIAHNEVSDQIVERAAARVLAGMGLLVLHSSHFSKIFRRLLGTTCSLKWAEDGEKERVWNIAPDHPITQGIGEYFMVPQAEMYGERFDIPEPERLIFLSWFPGGEVFRSGCAFQRGNGRIFYFRPGHETYPIYYQEEIIRILTNAVRWAAPRILNPLGDAPQVKNRLEPINQGNETA
jgi:trehalose utilization protein